MSKYLENYDRQKSDEAKKKNRGAKSGESKKVDRDPDEALPEMAPLFEPEEDDDDPQFP